MEKKINRINVYVYFSIGQQIVPFLLMFVYYHGCEYKLKRGGKMAFCATDPSIGVCANIDDEKVMDLFHFFFFFFFLMGCL